MLTDYPLLEDALERYAMLKRGVCDETGERSDLPGLVEAERADGQTVVILVPETNILEELVRLACEDHGPFVRLRYLSEVYLRMMDPGEALNLKRGDLQTAYAEGDMRVDEALSVCGFGPTGEFEVMLWRRTAYDDEGRPTWPDAVIVAPWGAEGRLIDAIREALR